MPAFQDESVGERFGFDPQVGSLDDGVREGVCCARVFKVWLRRIAGLAAIINLSPGVIVDWLGLRCGYKPVAVAFL